MRFNNNFLPSAKQEITDFLQGFRQEYYPEGCGDCCRNCLHDLALSGYYPVSLQKSYGKKIQFNKKFKIGFLLLFCPLDAHEKSSGRVSPPVFLFSCYHR
jgi:hypothetical protein